MSNIKVYDDPIYSLEGTYKAKAEKLKGGGQELGMDAFLKLLAAQLANQDMMNPNNDTQFIAQMAQFSSLQSMDSLAKMTMVNQSTSLIGKNVIVAMYDKSGKLQTDKGVVERVTVFGDTPKIIVNGTEYEYSNIMEIINTVEKTNGESTDQGDGTENTGDSNQDDQTNPVQP